MQTHARPDRLANCDADGGTQAPAKNAGEHCATPTHGHGAAPDQAERRGAGGHVLERHRGLQADERRLEQAACSHRRDKQKDDFLGTAECLGCRINVKGAGRTSTNGRRALSSVQTRGSSPPSARTECGLHVIDGMTAHPGDPHYEPVVAQFGHSDATYGGQYGGAEGEWKHPSTAGMRQVCHNRGVRAYRIPEFVAEAPRS